MKWLEHKIPPPVVLAAIAAAMWGLVRWASFADISLPGKLWWSLLSCVLGATIAISGVLSFRRRGTTINPLQPKQASALVATGVYRFTRNPMYLGMLLGLVGWGLLLSNWVCLAGWCVFVGVLNRLQIVPEERALAEIFGEEFQSYRARVRRWI